MITATAGVIGIHTGVYNNKLKALRSASYNKNKILCQFNLKIGAQNQQVHRRKMSHYVGGKFFILLTLSERMVYWIINKKIYFIKIKN